MSMTSVPDLPTVWAFIIAFAVFAYVVMDGFDLGIGILFPFFRPGPERDSAMNSVAPVWDGNETWLVLGGGGLMAAFPLAYAIILPALYAPIIAMVLALVFRGVAFAAVLILPSMRITAVSGERLRRPRRAGDRSRIGRRDKR
jgi:cytochrome d ubiquinol oxidase subunit II